MDHRDFRFALAGALAALLACPALAATSASVSLGPLTVQLTDLDALDGVAPSITFLAPAFGAANTIQASAYDIVAGSSAFQDSSNATAPFGSGAATASVGTAQSSASLTSSGSANGSTLAASGSTADVDGPSFAFTQFVGNVTAPGFGFPSFLLSAHTMVTLSGFASAAVSGSNTTNAPLTGSDIAAASATLQLSGSDGAGGFNFGFDRLDAYGNTQFGGAFNVADSRLLTVSFSNLSADEIGGIATIAVNATGLTYANTVPEPAAWALWLVGLAAMRPGRAWRRMNRPRI